MNEKCNICPRRCNAERYLEKSGYCGVGNKIYVARAALHFWEEPCISGKNGSGTVFFSGCNMKCVFCQNKKISIEKFGKETDICRLKDIFLSLQSQGAHNINLVTPTHYAYEIAEAIDMAKSGGLSVPVVYNSSGYESVETLKMLSGYIDIYLPDFKYWDSDIAKKYSNAQDYTEVAKSAIDEMFAQRPNLFFDENGILLRGVMVRHMLLPNRVYDAKRIVKYLYEKYGDNIILSLMSQYTPVFDVGEKYPELSGKVKKSEYERLVSYAVELGAKNVYIQEKTSANEEFIPDFTGDL